MVLIVLPCVLEASFFVVSNGSPSQLTTQWSQWSPRVTHSPLRTSPESLAGTTGLRRTDTHVGLRALLASATWVKDFVICGFCTLEELSSLGAAYFLDEVAVV